MRIMKPEILTHPNIPKPLHGIAPRTIFGQEWWDVERKKCYAAAGQQCEACGTKRADAWPSRWLEAHEEYVFHSSGIIEFKGLVCLCPACHKFIHSGLRSHLVYCGEMSEQLNDKIQSHGMKILKENGLVRQWAERLSWSTVDGWNDFQIKVGDCFYGPSTASYDEWKAGLWRGWTPEKYRTETEQKRRRHHEL